VGLGVLWNHLPQLLSGIVNKIGCKKLAFGGICDSGGLEKVVEVVEIVWEVAWVERVERRCSALAAAWHGGKRRHNHQRRWGMHAVDAQGTQGDTGGGAGVGCGMRGMQDAWDAGCVGCGMHGMRDAGCMGCGMHGMRGCGMRDARDAVAAVAIEFAMGFKLRKKCDLKSSLVLPFLPTPHAASHAFLSLLCASPAAYSSPCSVARLAPHLTATGPSHTMMPRMHAHAAPPI